MDDIQQQASLERGLFYWLRGYIGNRAHRGEPMSAAEIEDLLRKTDPNNPDHALAGMHLNTPRQARTA